MFSTSEASFNRSGSHRLGGPLQFKTIWPVVLEDLRQAYLTDGGPAERGAAHEVPGAELEPPSFSEAA